MAKLETDLANNVDDRAAEPPPPSYIEEGAPVHCSECGNNTFREQHNAIMCSNCGHGPFCNYCWKVHIRDFHPLLAQPYEDATRGIRRKARFLNHYLIRTVVKPAGLVLGATALFTAAYFAYLTACGRKGRFQQFRRRIKLDGKARTSGVSRDLGTTRPAAHQNGSADSEKSF